MSGIVWEDPPQDALRPRADRQKILGAVVERPGTWARLGEWEKKSTAQQAASDIRRGRVATSEAGSYEAIWRQTDENVFAVWVRWLPAGDGPTPP